MKRITIGIFIIIGIATAGFAQVLDKPAATINYHESDIITVKQLEIAVNQMRQQYSMTGQPMPSKGSILEELIISKLILQAAKKEDVSVTESEVKAAVRAQLGPSGVNVTDEQLKMLIRQQTGMSWADYLKQGKDQLMVQNYIKMKKKSLFENISPPSEEEIREIYNENQHLFINPEMVRFSQIFRDTRTLSREEKRKALELMEEIYRDFQNGRAEFDELVIKYSDDTKSRYQGGDVGYLPRNDVKTKQLLGKELFNAAFETPVGETTGIIESNIGYHILKVTEKLPARILGLNDKVTPASNETVRERIISLKTMEQQQKLFQQAVGEIVNDLKRYADITIYADNVEISVSELSYFKENVRS
jgi:parvulin-like peptidyl-prolyl isomerase